MQCRLGSCRWKLLLTPQIASVPHIPLQTGFNFLGETITHVCRCNNDTMFSKFLLGHV